MPQRRETRDEGRETRNASFGCIAEIYRVSTRQETGCGTYCITRRLPPSLPLPTPTHTHTLSYSYRVAGEEERGRTLRVQHHPVRLDAEREPFEDPIEDGQVDERGPGSAVAIRLGGPREGDVEEIGELGWLEEGREEEEERGWGVLCVRERWSQRDR